MGRDHCRMLSDVQALFVMDSGLNSVSFAGHSRFAYRMTHFVFCCIVVAMFVSQLLPTKQTKFPVSASVLHFSQPFPCNRLAAVHFPFCSNSCGIFCGIQTTSGIHETTDPTPVRNKALHYFYCMYVSWAAP